LEALTTKGLGGKKPNMLIIGCDYHPGFQQIAFVDKDTGELTERRLGHREEAEQFYHELKQRNQPLAGDGSIVARIASLSGCSNYQAGVMIRESLSPGSTEAFVFFYPNQANFYTRLTTGGYNSDQLTGVTSPAYPYWAKLVRSGNSFSAYISADAFNWTQIGTATSITMASNVYVGLTSTDGLSGCLETTTFDDVSVNSAASPAPVITSLSSTTGAVGMQIAVNGSNFGSAQGSGAVLLNGSPVTINQWSDTSIVFTIPSGATSWFRHCLRCGTDRTTATPSISLSPRSPCQSLGTIRI